MTGSAERDPRPPSAAAPVALLQRSLAALPAALGAAAALRRLIDAGADRLPLPAGGATRQRWQALAAVAAHDLSLVKLYEGHTDALATLAELGAVPLDGTGHAPPAMWTLWAAESPGQRVTVQTTPAGRTTLHGLKTWCSGAEHADHALLTAWLPDGQGPQLVRVALRQPAIALRPQGWQAVGMAGSASIDVQFDGAVAHIVGAPGDYLGRPGFWHGGAGIAACWHGGACALGQVLARHVAALAERDDGTAPQAVRLAMARAALGRVDVQLASTAALLRETAAWIDQHPRHDASAPALRARLAAEHCATAVLADAGSTLGATPFCRDARFARLAADLPVFVRQSHGARDQAALGERLAGVAAPAEAPGWSL